MKNVLTAFGESPAPFKPAVTRAEHLPRRSWRTVFFRPAVDGVVVEPFQEALQGGAVQHGAQLQRSAMLAQTHPGFAKGPILVAHQTEHGQQLRHAN
jgi:hypothetical protein